MSLGFGWQAHLALSDGKTAAYTYRTYDFSLPCYEDGYGIHEDDGLIWVTVTDGEELEIELEKASRYCSGRGGRLFNRCANCIRSSFEREGELPPSVCGNV